MLRVAERWLSIRLRRIVRLVTRTRWIVLSVTLAAVGLAGVWIAIPKGLNIALALVSVVLVCTEYLDHRRDIRSVEFVPRSSDKFDDVREAVAGDPRWEFLALRNGYILIDIGVTRALRASDLTAVIATDRYVPPPELRAIGNRYLDSVQADGAELFDGPMIGLAGNLGEPGSDTREVIFRSGTYYAHVGTDWLATVDVIRSGDRLTNLGRRLFLDRGSRLRPTGQSWLFNGVGVSTLAFTRDGMLVTLRQSNKTLNNPGLYAPAGSGALEPQDANGQLSLPLAQFICAGALRELREECAIQSREIELVLPLGFGRWLDQAGRPEFHSVAFLGIDSHQLRRRRTSISERAFVREIRFDRMPMGADRWHHGERAALLPPDIANSMSAVLETAIALLVDAVLDDGGRVNVELAQRGIL